MKVSAKALRVVNAYYKLSQYERSAFRESVGVRLCYEELIQEESK